MGVNVFSTKREHKVFTFLKYADWDNNTGKADTRVTIIAWGVCGGVLKQEAKMASNRSPGSGFIQRFDGKIQALFKHFSSNSFENSST